MTDLEAVALPAYVRPDGPRGRALAQGLAIAIVLTLVTGLVGLVAIRSGEEGASSPEDAVRRLVTAAEGADVIGALDVVEPAERDVLRQPLVDGFDQLKRIGVLSSTASLGGISGVKVRIVGLQLAPEQVGAGVTNVRVTGGTVTSSVDTAALPVGSLLRQTVQATTGTALPAKVTTSTESLAGADTVLTTVRRDGRWYVSIFYTAAEAARRDSGRAAPDFGKGVPARGASSPEGAVRAVVDAAVGLDVRRLIELTPPGEAAALHDYAPLFLPQAEKAATEARASGPKVTVSDLKLSTTRKGSRAVVAVDGFAATVVDGTTHGTVSYDGTCLTTSGFGSVQAPPCQRSAVPSMLPKQLHIATVEEGGDWYVSPTATVLGAVVDGLRAIDPKSLGPNGLGGLGASLFGGLGIVQGAASADVRGSSTGPASRGLCPTMTADQRSMLERSIDGSSMSPAEKARAKASLPPVSPAQSTTRAAGGVVIACGSASFTP